MTQQQLLHEFLALPAEAQRQVAELITSLRHKGSSANNGIQPIDFSSDPFVGIWKDRQDMTDSSAWVRNVRQAEW